MTITSSLIASDHLFRYRDFNSNTINELLTGNIWHSKYELLNDPFEFLFDFDWDDFTKANLPVINNHLQFMPNDMLVKYYLGNPQYLDACLKVLKQEINRILEFKINKIYKQTYVSCFASAYDNPLMWSHYSNGMQGICIAYNKEKMQSVEAFSHTVPVNYVTHPKKVKYTDLKLAYSDIKIIPINFMAPKGALRPAIQSIKFELNLHNYMFLIQKHNRWEYEGEVRNLSCKKYENGKPGVQENIGKESVNFVIFGYRITPSNLKVLELICKEKNIPLYKAKPNKQDYSVSIEKHIIS